MAYHAHLRIEGRRHFISVEYWQTPTTYYGTPMLRKTNKNKSVTRMSLERVADPERPESEALLTFGRLARSGSEWHLENATVRIALELPGEISASDALIDGALVRVSGTPAGMPSESHDAMPKFVVDAIELVHAPRVAEPELSARRKTSLAAAVTARSRANRCIREFFEAREFLEVETPNWVEAPGTDVHLAPVAASYRDPHLPSQRAILGHLHTSPEFSMKRLLAAGMERIWQMGKVWRNGEVTPLHNPEFTLLEWYRAWETLDAIMADVEDLSRALLGDAARMGGRKIRLDAPFARMTMQQLIDQTCGFDILGALSFDELLVRCRERQLLSDASLRRAAEHRRWDELFFELQIDYIDPFLSGKGAVFLTEWPTPLAVLARTKPEDRRVAQRFELYIGGVELANGFQELTDPAEQRRRFEQDLITRRAQNLPELPMPERFLEALEWGLPPSSGVAVGVDRYLMLQSGVEHIREVAPFAMSRDPQTGEVAWA
jgi:lysyl-tRNA synthetase class 2